MTSLSDYRRKRSMAHNAQIDKRLSRKLEFNLGWSDQTDEEYFGMLSDAYRCFRNLAVTEPPSDVETDADSVFSSVNSVSSASSTQSTGSSRSVSRYRQRYGRGGRVYVDRTLTLDEKEELEKNQLKHMLQNPALEERCKFDPRACVDEKPIELDEFSIEQISYRARILPPPPPKNIPGTSIRISSGSMSSPLMARPQLNSPSSTRQSLPFQTPK